MTLNPITAVIALFALGLAIRVALRLLYGVRGAAPRDPLYLSMGVLSWFFLLVAGGAFILASFFGALVPFFICAYASLEMVLARRTQQRQEAWSIVTRATASDHSVVSMLGENRERFRGSVGRAVRRFLDELGKGTPLASAIGNHRQAFPPQAQAHAALAKNGGLPISANIRKETSFDGSIELWRLSRRFSYLVWITLTMIAILSFIMVAIVPAFEEIFIDFGLELPYMTQILIEAATWPFASMLGAMVFCFIALLVLASLLAMLCYAFDIPILKRLTDRFFYAWHRADALHLLATVIDYRMPLADAIERLAYGQPRYPNHVVAKKLQRCNEVMNRGIDWKEAMCKANLLTSVDGELLHAAEGVGNISWALRSIADRQVARAEYRWEAGQQIAFTIVILLFGFFVGWVCLGMFLPLVKLIEGLT